MKTRNNSKVVSLLVAVAFVFSLLVAPLYSVLGVSSATAADDTAPVSLIDDTKTGSLSVHKYEMPSPAPTKHGNGKEDTSVDTTKPVKDVEFQIERLSYDLTTNAGWEALAALKGNTTEAAKNKDANFTAVKKLTDATGLATFADLALGAYLVTETKTPAGVVGSAPFVITVPLTEPEQRKTWMYDLHVYPKNAVLGEPEKTVNDTAATAVGDELSYTVKTEIPLLPDGETLNYYRLVDFLDPKLKDPSDVTVQMLGSTETLTAGTDYTVTTAEVTAANSATGDKSKYPAANVGRHVVDVVFTEAGRAKILAARKAGDQNTLVQFDFKAVVKETGVIDNQATSFTQEPNNNWDNGKTNEPVKSYYGDIKVIKTGTDKKADKSAYNGAEFQVFHCDAQGVLTSNTPISIADATGTKQDTFVTAGGSATENATVTIKGLHANDWKNGAAITDDAQKTWYCLKETKAPEGYEIIPEPIKFQIEWANIAKDNTVALEKEVTDVPADGGFKLPVTGANAVIWLIGAGMLFICGGLVLSFTLRRKAKQD